MVREGFTSSEYEIYVDLFNRASADLEEAQILGQQVLF